MKLRNKERIAFETRVCGACSVLSAIAALLMIPKAITAGSDGVRVRREALTCFETGSDAREISVAGWKAVNYMDRLDIVSGKEFEGAKGIYVGGATSKCDTAWYLVSPRVSVPEKSKRCFLSFCIDTTCAIPGTDVVSVGWNNVFRWYGRDGAEMRPSAMTHAVEDTGVSDIHTSVAVPDGAASVSIQFGYDVPDVGPGKRIVYRDVTLSFSDGTPADLKKGRYVSSIHDGGRVSWKADTPAGTSVRFRVRGGDDAESLLSAPYVTGSDVFMPEIYPVRGKKGDISDSTCVAVTIRDMEAVRREIRDFGDGKPRSVWPLLQWFKGWGWGHFPSRTQLFATSFAALVNGANGITWYTYGGFYSKKRKSRNEGMTSSPERWSDICELATWIRDLSPALLERTGPQPSAEVLSGPSVNRLGGHALTYLLKRHGGCAFLIAVNATTEKLRVRFRIGDVGDTAEAEKENQKLKCPGGVLEDEFGPMAVCVYRLADRFSGRHPLTCRGASSAEEG